MLVQNRGCGMWVLVVVVWSTQRSRKLAPEGRNNQ
jgi:hypothetical protein